MSNNTKTVFTVALVKSETELVINGGLYDGLKKGDKFIVYRIGDEILDPDTGENLGSLEVVIGYGEVLHAQEKMSTIVSSTRQRKPDTRKVYGKEDRDVLSSAGSIARLFAQGSNLREEIVPGELQIVPFERPKIGDKARKIG